MRLLSMFSLLLTYPLSGRNPITTMFFPFIAASFPALQIKINLKNIIFFKKKKEFFREIRKVTVLQLNILKGVGNAWPRSNQNQR
jgi:hypothetical protein